MTGIEIVMLHGGVRVVERVEVRARWRDLAHGVIGLADRHRGVPVRVLSANQVAAIDVEVGVVLLGELDLGSIRRSLNHRSLPRLIDDLVRAIDVHRGHQRAAGDSSRTARRSACSAARTAGRPVSSLGGRGPARRSVGQPGPRCARARRCRGSRGRSPRGPQLAAGCAAPSSSLCCPAARRSPRGRVTVEQRPQSVDADRAVLDAVDPREMKADDLAVGQSDQRRAGVAAEARAVVLQDDVPADAPG